MEDLNIERNKAKHIRKVFKMYGGNKNKTALVLGVSHRTLVRYLEQYNITL